jgi:hypothetical protein
MVLHLDNYQDRRVTACFLSVVVFDVLAYLEEGVSSFLRNVGV